MAVFLTYVERDMHTFAKVPSCGHLDRNNVEEVQIVGSTMDYMQSR